ncbi:MAG TPA: hypothetical protein VMI12_19610 [Puia sp.]|nr:hypothetical protein [Puia sp.]
MFLKLKSAVFIDRLTFEVDQQCMLKAVLKDDRGSICSAMEAEITKGHQVLDWNGLNDLPYGEYTLEVSKGTDEMKLRLVKRI